MKNKVLNTEESFDEQLSKTFPNYEKRMLLEGEVKIREIIFLKVHWPKAIFLTFLLIVTFFGLIALKMFKRMRVKVFYTQVPADQATCVFVQSQDGVQDIQGISKQRQGKIFSFKKLKYSLIKSKPVPVRFNFEQNFNLYFNKNHLSKGLSEEEQVKLREEFGRNEHTVDIPLYFEYLFDTLLGPFYLMQYLVCAAFIVERITVFAVVMLAFTFLTTTINYILLYISYLKIQAMAQKIVKVKVKRKGKFVEIDNHDLVPGDLLDPQGQMPCDCLLVQGDVYVNEASLTGESIPIAKFPVHDEESTTNDNRWLYEGAKVLQKRGDTLAMVINIGYATRRGRIIRKILSRVTKTPDLFWKAMMFLSECFVVGIIIYFGTLPFMLSKDIVPLFIGFRFIDFFGWSFPPTFPIYFNLAYSFSLGRLRRKNILGTQPQKTIESAKLQTMCFDKTGTLTQNAVEVHDIFRFQNDHTILEITDGKDDKANQLVFKLFATCHTTKEINGQFLGDEVDLRMFLFSEYKMSQSSDPTIKFVAKHSGKQHELQVLRVNQFQSKFQSMSVLVRDKTDNKIYNFLKGAPERIDRNSIVKVKGYDKKVSSLSLGGYRTIGFGYKVINEMDRQKYVSGPRELFQEGITALGLVAFENKLKHDTKKTIQKLLKANIEPKMITGDNIFIAVETGSRASIISRDQKVILLEGRKQPRFEKGNNRKFKGILLTRFSHETIQEDIELSENDSYLTQEYPIAVDNDFLMLDPRPEVTNKIKLFARISPQNKALVVNLFKNLLDKTYEEQSCCQRYFGPSKKKIGMCGDGANDLMAIKQSDVGIGINDSDASYGASFTIVNMLDVDEIIRQSKCTSTNVIEMFRYYGTISFIKITCSLLLLVDTTYFSGIHLIYFNFTSTVIIPLFMAGSFPSKNTNKYIPETNFMGLINHLRYWGNTIIPSAGLIAGYFYFINNPEFVPNETQVVTEAGFSTFNQSSTIMLLMVLIPFAFNGLFLYISKPWKVKIYKNYPLFILILLNIISSIMLFYLTPYMTASFGTVEISPTPVSICLAIMGLSTGLGYLFNQIIDQMEQHSADEDEED